MDNKEKQLVQNKRKGNNTDLLRVGVIFLSMVSFFTTARGMRQYIFENNSPVAYAASGAIQGILLALSMNLPGYLRNIYSSEKRTEINDRIQEKEEEKKRSGFLKKIGAWLSSAPGKLVRFLGKIFLAACALLLTIITIFCSTWFSYIYIAEVIHRDSWSDESELLVQQTYRTELYDAKDYAHNYRIYLEENVGRIILQLNEYTESLSNPKENNELNWENERENYVTGNGTVAGSYMFTVINAMEKAMLRNSSQEERELAATAIADAKRNMEERISDIQENLRILSDNFTNYNNLITTLQNRINRAPAGTDTTGLSNSIATYTQLIDNISSQQAELQTEYLQLDSAVRRLPYYESELGLASSNSAVSIRMNLRGLQADFFGTETDENELLNTVREIFENLQDAARGVGNDEISEAGLSYTRLFVLMNRLQQNLIDYIEVKDIESNLDRLIAELRTEDSPDTKISANTTISGQLESVSSSNPSESAGTVSSNEADSGTDDTGKKVPEDDWQKIWGKRIDELKAQISAMPIYTVDADTENEMGSILSESQINVLTNYDRDNSSRTLDDMIRRYISEHNAIYQGIIYLQSPYRSLALFALLLALSFDLSGFIYGFVGQKDESMENPQMDDNVPHIREEPDENPQMDDDIPHIQEESDENLPENTQVISYDPMLKSIGQTVSHVFANKKQRARSIPTIDSSGQTAWSIHKTLMPYIVLTGDYECRDGIYYYKAFKDGVSCHWKVQDTAAYAQGIYIQENNDKEWERGLALPESEQELLFARQSENPKDGIYRNCQLIYDEGSLILSKGEQQIYLACIGGYVPVHRYNPDQGESRTIPSKKLTKKKEDDQVIVVALNTKGTRIAAIYIIEHIS